MLRAVRWAVRWAAACLVGRWSPEWERPWAAWVRQVEHLVVHLVALHLDQHRVLVDRVVPNKLVAQVVPARRVQDPAVLRAVALAVLADKADKADKVGWPWPLLAATT